MALMDNEFKGNGETTVAYFNAERLKNIKPPLLQLKDWIMTFNMNKHEGNFIYI
jgi:hypothetical protein